MTSSEHVRWVMRYFVISFTDGQERYDKFIKDREGRLDDFIKNDEAFKKFMEDQNASGIRRGLIKRLNIN